MSRSDARDGPIKLDGEQTLDLTDAPEGDVYVLVRLGGRVDVRRIEEGHEVVVGRDAGLDVVVDDSRVSRKQAAIAVRKGDVEVTDLGSRNGTRVGARVLRDEIGRARAGDVIVVGPAEIIVARHAHRTGATPASADDDGEDRTTDGLVVADANMVQLLAVIRRVAITPSNVLVIGEKGVGKTFVAERLHAASRRLRRPFVRVDCASVPDVQLEAALFGVEPGAIIGLESGHPSYFEAADGGTLLLEEVGQLSIELQAKVLRVLERRALVRVGATVERPVDVRLIGATQRDLVRDVEDGRFRRDLYDRIAAITLDVPPLRARPLEVALLTHVFAHEFAQEVGFGDPKFSDQALASLTAHAWPGNVPELRSAIEHALVMAQGAVVEPRHLPRTIIPGTPALASPPAEAPGVRGELEALERQRIVAALDAEGGNQTKAAKRLGISRRALVYKMQKYQLRS